MSWLWLILGVALSLVFGLWLGFVIGGRRHARAAVTRPNLNAVEEPTPHPHDPSYREAVWSLRLAERRRDTLGARLLAADARRQAAERHAEEREIARDGLHDEIRALTQDLAVARRDREAAENRLAEVETERALAAAHLERATSELDAGDERHDAVVEAAEARSAALEAALASAQSRGEATAAALAEADTRIAALRIRSERMESELVETRRERERLVHSVRTFTEEANRQRGQHAALEDASRDAEDRSEKLRSRLVQVERDLDDARAASRADAELTTRLLRDLEDAEHRASQASAAGEHARQEAASLRTVIVSLRRHLDEREGAERTESASRVRIAELQRRLDTLSTARRGEVDRLSVDLERSRRSSVSADERAAKIVELEQSLATASERRREAEEAAGHLAARSAGLEERLAAAADELRELDALRSRHEALRRSHVDAKESLEAIAGHPAAEEIDRLRAALRSERDRALRLGSRTSSADDVEVSILRSRIMELEDLVMRMEISRTGPDDLTLVRGVGPAIRDMLADEGITTFAQLAGIGQATLDRIRAKVPVYPERIERDRWIEQASALAASKRP